MPSPGGCAPLDDKTIKKLYPQLKVNGKWILPRPEPNPVADAEDHRRWRREYPLWKDTIKCGCGKGYYCREHGLWVRGNEAADKDQRELDQYGYPNCPVSHYPGFDNTDDKAIDQPTEEEEDYPRRGDSEFTQEFERLDLGTDPSQYPMAHGQHHDESSAYHYGTPATMHEYTEEGHGHNYQTFHQASPRNANAYDSYNSSYGAATSGGYLYPGPEGGAMYQDEYQGEEAASGSRRRGDRRR